MLRANLGSLPATHHRKLPCCSILPPSPSGLVPIGVLCTVSTIRRPQSARRCEEGRTQYCIRTHHLTIRYETPPIRSSISNARQNSLQHTSLSPRPDPQVQIPVDLAFAKAEGGPSKCERGQDPATVRPDGPNTTSPPRPGPSPKPHFITRASRIEPHVRSS